MDYRYSLPYEYEKPPPAIPVHHYPPPPPITADTYYLHHHHHHPQPPPPQQPAIVCANTDIHTLFISGLPEDVKAREIHNLFRRLPGFDSSLLEYTGRGDQVVAFATFSSHQTALAALAELNVLTFDRETGATLHIELARSNSRRRPRGDGAYDIIDKRAKVKSEEQNTWSNEGTRKADGAQAAINGQSEKPSSDDVSPCSTLFIANLNPTCTEEELEQILLECNGFLVLKMPNKGGKPVAFADFYDVETSTKAKEKLLGTSQASADDAGLHVEYARSKMRKI